MKAIIAQVAFLFLFGLVFVKPVFAVSLTITSYPNTITDQLFTVTASISGASAGQNYLRVDLYKEGTDKYFGETFNGSDWYSGSDGKSYLPITIDSSKLATSTVQVRAGSPGISEYDGSGTYKMRLRRYTSGGGYTSSEANSSAVIVSINLPTSTPTPTVTVQSTPDSTPTPTPTPTSTPISVKTPTPTLKISPSISPSQQVLGSTKSSSIFPTNHPQNTPKTEVLGAHNNNISKVLIGMGFVFIAACVILIFRSIKNKKLERIEIKDE